MPQILTLTLNPALDLATSTPQVVPVKKLRCGPESAEPGGGGVNVARAIEQLGGQARAAVAVGGDTGKALSALLDQFGVAHIHLQAPGETRRSFSVTDEGSGAQYRFVMQGPVWTSATLDQVLTQLDSHSTRGDFVVVSGSMPPGVPGDLPVKLCASLPGRRLIVDTSGPALAALAQGSATPPAILRMDRHEAQELSGKALAHQKDTAEFAETLRQAGAAETVIIARGKEGSVMACPDGLWHVNASNDHVVSAIGAGDSFVGGMVRAMADNQPLTEAFRQGAAAASAACLSEGSQLCRKEDFERLLPLTSLTPI
ncbi:MAG: 1-phosphofructokinase family hexose kinase [Pelagimonas sp.]|jgi:6-phosphofructokinase 2|nr:1-phosphofructokinase family hexose kinase [Pelagimonas sp.]